MMTEVDRLVMKCPLFHFLFLGTPLVKNADRSAVSTEHHHEEEMREQVPYLRLTHPSPERHDPSSGF